MLINFEKEIQEAIHNDLQNFLNWGKDMDRVCQWWLIVSGLLLIIILIFGK